MWDCPSAALTEKNRRTATRRLESAFEQKSRQARKIWQQWTRS